MEETTSREKVLKKVRNALIDQIDSPEKDIDWESSVYKEMSDPLDVSFAQEFTKAAGKFLYCENEDDFGNNLKMLAQENDWDSIYCLDPVIAEVLSKHDIRNSSDEKAFLDQKVGITRCEYLIARLGSILVSSAHPSGRRMNVYPEVHIVVAYTSQLVPDIKDALKAMKNRYGENLPSMISCITGPSRTADIEKTLVMGAHGPKELYLFLIENRN